MQILREPILITAVDIIPHHIRFPIKGPKEFICSYPGAVANILNQALESNCKATTPYQTSVEAVLTNSLNLVWSLPHTYYELLRKMSFLNNQVFLPSLHLDETHPHRHWFCLLFRGFSSLYLILYCTGQDLLLNLFAILIHIHLHPKHLLSNT